MSNRPADNLFQLVKSLRKSEKRNFKLFVKRNSSTVDLKSIQLFDVLEKLNYYDEKQLLKKAKSIKKQQLSNLKAQLYKQLLASLRLIRDEENIDIILHDQMDHARILFNKGLYLQSLRAIERLKEMARSYHQLTYLQQALFFEKKIEALYITLSMQNRAEQLSGEADMVNAQLAVVNQLSNLSLQLYSWYIRNGHARNEADLASIKEFFESELPPDIELMCGFYEKLYLYQSYCWYAFIRQNFLQYYRYAQKWVDLFDSEPYMIEIETANYIKGMHNLLGAHFDLQNYNKFEQVLARFERFAKSTVV